MNGPATPSPTWARLNGHSAEAVTDIGGRDLSDAELLEAICGGAGLIARHTSTWLTLIGECDQRAAWNGHGLKSCAHWLAWACSISPGTAREHVRVARALRDLPLVQEQFRLGRLSYSKVRSLTRICHHITEEELLDLALTATAAQLDRIVAAYRRTDDDRLDQETRRRTSWHTTESGSVQLNAHLPAEEAALLVAALNAASDALNAANESADRCSPTDALLELVHHYLTTTRRDRSGEDRNLVVVHIDAAALTETDSPATASVETAHRPPESGIRPTAVPSTGACQIAGIGGITAATAARLACDATIIGVIRGRRGSVLNHGRRQRTVTAAQRRALAIRDGSCQHPGCQRTTHLEAHHVQHWANLGPTDLDNLILLCRYHHMLIHEAKYTITHALDSRPGRPVWTFHDPAGLHIHPDPMISLSVYTGGEHHGLYNALTRARNQTRDTPHTPRPGWQGEHFDLDHILGVLFAHPRRPQAPAADSDARAA